MLKNGISNEIKITRFLLILLILLGLGAAAFWIFVLNNLKNLKLEGLNAARELEKTENKIKNFKALETTFAELKEKKEKIEKSVIGNEKGLVKFIENLEFLASKSGGTLNLQSIQTPKETETSYPSLNIELKGDFEEIYYFIEMLESLSYFISFEQLSIQKNPPKTIAQFEQKGEKGYKWTSKINLRLLSYKISQI